MNENVHIAHKNENLLIDIATVCVCESACVGGGCMCAACVFARAFECVSVCVCVCVCV